MEKVKELERAVNELETKIKRVENDIDVIGSSQAIRNKLENFKSLLKIKREAFKKGKELFPYYKETK